MLLEAILSASKRLRYFEILERVGCLHLTVSCRLCHIHTDYLEISKYVPSLKKIWPSISTWVTRVQVAVKVLLLGAEVLFNALLLCTSYDDVVEDVDECERWRFCNPEFEVILNQPCPRYY